MIDATNELRQALDDAVLTHTGRSIGGLASQRVLDDIMPCIAALLPAQASEPRASIQHFARLGMERKLAANDGVKCGWRDEDWVVLYERLQVEVAELLRALLAWRHDRDDAGARDTVLSEAADVSNYAMMIADVCGALPPTDERGR